MATWKLCKIIIILKHMEPFKKVSKCHSRDRDPSYISQWSVFHITSVAKKYSMHHHVFVIEMKITEAHLIILVYLLMHFVASGQYYLEIPMDIPLFLS